MKKTILIFTLTVLVFLFLGYQASVDAQYLDLDCQKMKILDTTYMGDCQITDDLEFVFVRDQDCVDNGPAFQSCADLARANGHIPNDYRCLRTDDVTTFPPVSAYECKRVHDSTGAQCLDVDCTIDNNKRCTYVNLFAVEGDAGTVRADIQTWTCVDQDSLFNLNVFGVNMGPADVAMAKISRTAMTGFFVFFAILSTWRFINALWRTTTKREAEAFEDTQKEVRDAILGLIFAGAGIIVVQLFANLFGISGNIFEFTYIADL